MCGIVDKLEENKQQYENRQRTTRAARERRAKEEDERGRLCASSSSNGGRKGSSLRHRLKCFMPPIETESAFLRGAVATCLPCCSEPAAGGGVAEAAGPRGREGGGPLHAGRGLRGAVAGEL